MHHTNCIIQIYAFSILKVINCKCHIMNESNKLTNRIALFFSCKSIICQKYEHLNNTFHGFTFQSLDGAYNMKKILFLHTCA